MNPKDLKVTITAVPVEVPPMTLEEAQRLAAQAHDERIGLLFNAFLGGYVHPEQEDELKAFRHGMATASNCDERMRLALVWALSEVGSLRTYAASIVVALREHGHGIRKGAEWSTEHKHEDCRACALVADWDEEKP